MNELQFATSRSALMMNFDIGVQKVISKYWQVGLVASNLIPRSYIVDEDNPKLGTVSMTPQVDVAIAFTLEPYLLAEIEYDLFDDWGVGQNIAKSRYFRAGVEFGKEDKFGAIRIGFIRDVNEVRSDVWTAGFGYMSSVKLGFSLAGMYSFEGGFGGSLSLNLAI